MYINWLQACHQIVVMLLVVRLSWRQSCLLIIMVLMADLTRQLLGGSLQRG